MIYSLLGEPDLAAPVMVSALSGWVDAASAGTSAADHLAHGGEVVARFDGDMLFDYRSQRPILDIVDGEMKRTVWPEVVVRHSSVGGRDVLVLTGQEPDLAWRGFAEGVAEIASHFTVSQLVTFGSVPAAVPHTLAPPIMTTASDRSLLKGEASPPEGLLRVPAAAVSMVDLRVAEAGIPTVVFFVQVPHYVSSKYASGVLALLTRFAEHLGIDMPLDPLRDDARAHREQLDSVIADQPEAQEHVRQLEEMNAEQRIVSGEELASEIERYLREHPSRGSNEPDEDDR